MNGPSPVDPVLENRIRAGVMAYLSSAGGADFVELAAAMDLANNSLSGHLQRLETSAYIELRRGFFGRKPRTRVVLTLIGRAAWLAHLERLSGAG